MSSPFAMSRATLIRVLVIPVFLWVGVSYSAVPFLVAESDAAARLLLFGVWVAGSLLYLLALRYIARAVRRSARGGSRAA